MTAPILRLYTEDEAGEHRGRRSTSRVGYPFAWKICPRCEGTGRARWPHHEGGTVTARCEQCWGAGSIKNLIRQQAGHRCVRCCHPFRVGVSGEMDGPSASAKATAASLDLNVETFDAAILDVDIELSPVEERRIIETAPRVNWSDCDGRCRHGGPMRVRTRGQLAEEWTDFDPTPEACGPAIEAVAPSKVQASWRILTVHRLDENKLNCRWWNLLALCQRCHLAIQGKVDPAQVYPFEHTAWFKPYAAGYYALAYLGEELSREEAESRQDELLALEQSA